jgi:hypothetical protein
MTAGFAREGGKCALRDTLTAVFARAFRAGEQPGGGLAAWGSGISFLRLRRTNDRPWERHTLVGEVRPRVGGNHR